MSAHLLIVGFQALHNPGNSKFVVSLGTIQSAEKETLIKAQENQRNSWLPLALNWKWL